MTTAHYCHFSVLLVGALKDASRFYAYNKACAIAVRMLFITSPGVFFVKLNLYGFFSELIFLCLMHINNNRLMSHFHHFLLSFTFYLFIMFMIFKMERYYGFPSLYPTLFFSTSPTSISILLLLLIRKQTSL